MKSYHPLDVKKSIPYSQVFRIRRICDSKESLETRAIELKSLLKKRGYSQAHVESQVDRVRLLDRKGIIKGQRVKLQYKCN